MPMTTTDRRLVPVEGHPFTPNPKNQMQGSMGLRRLLSIAGWFLFLYLVVTPLEVLLRIKHGRHHP